MQSNDILIFIVLSLGMAIIGFPLIILIIVAISNKNMNNDKK